MPRSGWLPRVCTRPGAGRFLPFALPIALLAGGTPAWAQWDREHAGIFIYQRDVPTQPAQIVGEPGAPGQIILSGPDSPFDTVMHIGSIVTDLEASNLTAQPPDIPTFNLPDAPPSATEPQNLTGYAETLSQTVSGSMQGTIAGTVEQATTVLNNATAAIGGILSSIPSASDF